MATSSHWRLSSTGVGRPVSRRRFLAVAGAAAAVGLSGAPGVFAVDPAPATRPTTGPRANAHRYKVGVVDLMMLKRQKLGAIQLAGDVGADGVEVDMGGLGDRPTFDNKLAEPEVRKQFLDASAGLGVEICSLAMTGYFAQSFPERDGAERTVQDCIDTMKQVGVKVAFLPLGVKGDLVKQPDLRPKVVGRLRAVGAAAEKAGVVIGVETAYDADGDKKLLDDVGSPAVRVYFNFSNAVQNGRDLVKELRALGKDRICQIHCTNQDGVWLQEDPKIDMPKVKAALDDMGWAGWLVVERSRRADKPRDVKGNFSANVKFMKSVFQPDAGRS